MEYNYLTLAVYWVDNIDSIYSYDYRVQCYKDRSEMEYGNYDGYLRVTTVKGEYENPDSGTGLSTGYKVTVELVYSGSEPQSWDYPTRYSFERVGENLKRVDYIDLSYVNNMSRMFYGCHYFIGFYYNPTTNPFMFGIGHLVTDTSYMFCDCYSLCTSKSGREAWLDMTLWHFNTSNVTNMKGMFKGLRSCSHIIIPDTFDTSNVTDMSEMFYGFSGYGDAKTLELPSNFNTSKVTNMSKMFTRYHYDEELDIAGEVVSPSVEGDQPTVQSLDLSMFDTSNVEDMSYMFAGLDYMTSLNLNGFDTSKVSKMEYMFTYCKSLEELDISGFDLKNINSLSGTFAYCEGLKTLNMNEVNAPSVTDLEGFLKGCVNLEHLELNGFYAPNVTNTSHLFEDLTKLQYVDISGLSTENVTDMSYMFKGCSALTSLDVSGLSTSKVTNMAHMFDGCSQVPVIDVSSFDVTNVKDISYMFNGCSLVETLAIEDFTLTGLTSTENVFANCANITSLDLSKWGSQPDVISTKSMFEGCSSLESIVLCGFTGGNIWDLSYMFAGCSKLQSLTGGALYTDNATTLAHMFDGCKLLTDISEYLKHFYTSNVKSMEGLFKDCESLQFIDIETFDASNVTNMAYMFAGCSKVSRIELNNLIDTSKVKTMESMFEGCSSLNSDFHDTLKTDSVTNMARMYKNCGQIVSVGSPSWYLGKVTTMESMMEGCSHLQHVSFSVSDTYSTLSDKMTNLKNLCKDCVSLKGVVINKIVLTNVAFDDATNDMEGIFEGCPNVEFIYLDRMNYGYGEVGRNKFNWLIDHIRTQCINLKELHIDNLTGQPLLTCKSLFKDFTKLEKIYMKDFNLSGTDDMSEMFMGCQNLKTIDLSDFDQQYANVYHMDSMFRNCTSLETLNINALKTNSLRTANDMFRNCSNLSQLVFAEENEDSNNFEWLCLANGMFSGCNRMTYLEIPNFNVTRIGATKPTPTTFLNDMTDMFMGCASLKTVVLDNFKIDNTTAPDVGDITTVTREGDARLETFFTTLTTGAPNITKLAVTNFDNFYLTSMKGMFKNFKKVEEIVLTNCNTSRITDMSEMFYKCSELKKLDLSSFNTSSVTTMESMFQATGDLTTFDISSFNFSKVKTMHNMFYQSKISYLDMSNFDTTGKVTDMAYMFFLTGKLSKIDNLNKLNTSSVTTMTSMFSNSKVKELDLSNFITSKVTRMNCMFEWCSNLINIDLSNFVFSSVTDMSNMFDSCVKLESIDLSHNTFTNYTTITSLFKNCTNLKRVDMSGMLGKATSVGKANTVFQDCSALEYIDMSNFYYATTPLYNPTNKNIFSGVGNNVLNVGALYLDSYVCSKYAERIANECSTSVRRINIYVLDADPAECSCDDPRVRFIKYEREEKQLSLPVTLKPNQTIEWDEERREYFTRQLNGTNLPVATNSKSKIKMETYSSTMYMNFDIEKSPSSVTSKLAKVQVAMKEKIEEESEE